MIYSIFPQHDSTIYERTESMNTGLDSILELTHEYLGTGYKWNTRIVMKFDMSYIEQQINAGKISNNAKYYLVMKTAEVKEIPQEYTIYAYPISSSWMPGTGRYANKPGTTDGVSWTYRTAKSMGVKWQVPPLTSSFEWDDISETWIQDDGIWGNNVPTVSVTSSYCSVTGGGTWWDYDELECTQSFSYSTTDLYMDVTSMFSKWITGSGRLENDGLLIKFGDEIERSKRVYTTLRYFANDSNTIYAPKVHVVWDDSQYITGSLEEISTDNMNMNVKLKKYYSQDEKAKIKIYANEKFVRKGYSTKSYQLQNYRLPSSSYYEIRDAHTDEIILPFNDIGTKISCDGTSSYFNLWMNAFQPERFYRVAIKTVTDGGDVEQIYDNNYYFKVTR
jgi:hypothetical protein